ncbi:hypothetical protein Oscil6304_1217 [Oscillatoria acuminata PCC 6304]|uniref:Uncharacterized protein n=1 Tax=Oscillatoria acuminata PCC 6304 TaxID=56110 RepID=K9TDI7_9CYAN|nr:hypothetical protein Oscil6304_1217 [Oscillatoria acuminata PCC 6304]
MIGFKTVFGLQKENGRIALTLASLSQGQPEVTRFILLNPIVKHRIYPLARAGGLCPYASGLQPAGFYIGSVFFGSV